MFNRMLCPVLIKTHVVKNPGTAVTYKYDFSKQNLSDSIHYLVDPLYTNLNNSECEDRKPR